MYKIFADDTLIYDSTLEDYKIGKGSITLETNKSGSFIFSIYPDHFFYDKFVKLKTVITVLKSGKIVFRGRILNDVSDHWNNKVITCEGELGFLQDSIIRPFEFSGTPENLFKQFIESHNSQVDEFKRFKIGKCTVVDANDYIIRSSNEYSNTLSALSSRTIDSTLGGYIHITHGDNGDDPIPTIHYLSDFTKVATQSIEFGENLKQYTKTVDASDLATAIIPLGATIDDGDDATEDKRLTISDINGGKDYVYDSNGVALYGWIFQTVEFDDVTIATNLKRKGEETLNSKLSQNVMIELTAIDLHLLDTSIEGFCLNDYIKVLSSPHKFNETMLCNKQTLDLLKPDNDTVTLGKTYQTFTEKTAEAISSATVIKSVKGSLSNVNQKVNTMNNTMNQTLTETERRFAALEESLADALYEEISISKFTNNINTIEIGSTVNNVTFAWTFSRTPEKITLDGEIVDSLTGITKTGLSIVGSSPGYVKTWTLKATDEREFTATKTTTATFLNGVYYGALESDAAINDTVIRGLSKKLQNSKSITFTVDTTNTKRLTLAIPTRLGTPTINIGGLDYVWEKVSTFDFTNASGYLESYDVWQHYKQVTGSITVKVS